MVFYLGLDLGKKHDHTAVVIVERRGNSLLVRHLERMALGTPYTAVVARVQEIVERTEREGQCAVVVDGTGVGEPESRMGSTYNVPKQDLIAGVQMAMEKGELRVARRLVEAGALMKELMN